MKVNHQSISDLHTDIQQCFTSIDKLRATHTESIKELRDEVKKSTAGFQADASQINKSVNKIETSIHESINNLADKMNTSIKKLGAENQSLKKRFFWTSIILPSLNIIILGVVLANAFGSF